MCRQSAQSVAVVRAPERKVIVAREFDECDNCTFDDQKARLDNLAVELQTDPSARATSSRTADATARSRRWKC